MTVVEGVGTAAMLTRGWLRGTQRRRDDTKSTPWQPVHAHEAREALTPGEIHEFNIEIRPSHLLPPVTRGNVIGTFCSGGTLEAV